MTLKGKIALVIGTLIMVPAIFMAVRSNDNVEATEVMDSLGKPVEAVKVINNTISDGYTYSGKTIPKATIQLVAKMPGTVTAVHKDIGDTVKKGDVLLTVDTREIENGIADINAQIDAAKLSLDIQESVLSQDKQLLEKNQKLYEAGAISKNDMELLETKISSSEKQVKQSKLNITRLYNSLDKLKIKLSDATIVSPIDGVVNKRNIDSGEVISSSIVAFEIIDMSEIYIDVDVTQGSITDVKSSEKIRVDIPAVNSNNAFDGYIVYSSPAADDKKLTYKTRIGVSNDENIIQPGMLAEIEFVTAINDDAILVPISSVMEVDGENYIYLAVDGIAKITKVETGIENEEVIEILSDIPNNAIVVTKGKEYLVDGEKIIIVD